MENKYKDLGKRVSETMAYIGMIENLRPVAKRLIKSWIRDELKVAYLDGKYEGMIKERQKWLDEE